jgi:hypothetical protein
MIGPMGGALRFACAPGRGIAADGPVNLEQRPMGAMHRKLRPLPPAKRRGVISSESWYCEVQNVSPIE